MVWRAKWSSCCHSWSRVPLRTPDLPSPAVQLGLGPPIPQIFWLRRPRRVPRCVWQRVSPRHELWGTFPPDPADAGICEAPLRCNGGPRTKQGSLLRHISYPRLPCPARVFCRFAGRPGRHGHEALELGGCDKLRAWLKPSPPARAMMATLSGPVWGPHSLNEHLCRDSVATSCSQDPRQMRGCVQKTGGPRIPRPPLPVADSLMFVAFALQERQQRRGPSTTINKKRKISGKK